MHPRNDLASTLKSLIREGKATTQESLCQQLAKLGYDDVNQTKVSRLLRKIGAVKTKNENGDIVYHLPKEPPPPTPDSYLRDLVIDITHNEFCLIVHTSPGSASLIGRMLDYHRDQAGILGTIAGDDTVLVLPVSIKTLAEAKSEIIKILEEK